jgi:hypothetical protein
MRERKNKMRLRYKFGLKRSARRTRDKEEERVLILLDYARMKRMIEEGRFEILGKKRYRLNI